MDRTLIVAKYQEDTTWLSQVHGYNIIVYDKFDPLAQNHLPNVGREAQTYIHHIVKNYNNLSTVNVFTQGNPFEHCVNFLNNLNGLNDRYKYFELSNITIECDKQGLPAAIHPMPIEPFFDKIFPKYKCPNSFRMKGNGIFCVHKERILHHPLDFYVNIMNTFNSFEDAAWILERLWNLIFSGTLISNILETKSTSSVFRQSCLPVD